MKKILVLGATGAMATYLVPKLLDLGYKVVGVSLDAAESDHPHLTYIKANAMDMDFLEELLSENFDAIVDFMVYKRPEVFREYYELFVKNTKHYIFLSTYRIYAGEYPIKETSLRLIEAEKPRDFVSFEEYSIYKAEEEDLIRKSGYSNYTIVRPAITYSKRRFQLTTLEANVLVYRMKRGLTVVLPEGAMDCEATMSWAGDVADMFSAIILNPKAYGETYTLSTAEHHTWREIAEMYVKIGGLKYITAPDSDFVRIVGGSIYAEQQLKYDRCFNRIVDNSKILALSGRQQSELMPLFDGLKREYDSLDEEKLKKIGCNEAINRLMDEYLEGRK